MEEVKGGGKRREGKMLGEEPVFVFWEKEIQSEANPATDLQEQRI